MRFETGLQSLRPYSYGLAQPLARTRPAAVHLVCSMMDHGIEVDETLWLEGSSELSSESHRWKVDERLSVLVESVA